MASEAFLVQPVVAVAASTERIIVHSTVLGHLYEEAVNCCSDRLCSEMLVQKPTAGGVKRSEGAEASRAGSERTARPSRSGIQAETWSSRKLQLMFPHPTIKGK